MNSSAGTHTPAIPRCRKHRNSGPLFRWSCNKHSAHAANSSPVNFRHGSPKGQLSARKLAAGLWQLRFLEVTGDGYATFPDGSFHFSTSESRSKEEVTVTKRVPDPSEASNVVGKIHHSKKLLRERKLMGDSVVSALLAELLRAQRCINKLKAEQKTSKNKFEQFVKKLEQEKVLWKHRELRKIQATLDDLEDKLARERRSRERMELLNTKLVHEFAKANLCVNHFRTSYEEERKERELIEQVCNELAMQIGEDKAKLEGLQRDSMRIREEVEEERKMFQMADLWREESIQMKLVDARLALEDKYNQMIQLIAYLQSFLRSRGDELGTMEVRDAQLIKQAAESLNIQSITELSYDFSKSDDIFSICEKLRKGIVNERVIEPDSPPSLNGLSSTIHIVSLDEDGFDNNMKGLEVTNLCSTPQRTGTAPHKRMHRMATTTRHSQSQFEGHHQFERNSAKP